MSRGAVSRWHGARCTLARMELLHRLARPVGIAMLGAGVVAALASLGCGPSEPSRPVVEPGFWDEGRAETASVMAHAFDEDFEPAPIAEGDELRIDYGPQGGSHVELEVEAEGVDPDTTRMGARLERPDGTVVAEAFYDYYYGDSPGYSQRSFLQFFEDPSGPLLLRVRVRDGAGAQGTTEIGVTAR